MIMLNIYYWKKQTEKQIQKRIISIFHVIFNDTLKWTKKRSTTPFNAYDTNYDNELCVEIRKRKICLDC